MTELIKSVIILIMLLIITISLQFRELSAFDIVMVSIIYVFAGLSFYISIEIYYLEKIEKIIKELLKWK